MPLSLEFLRGVLGFIGIACAFMLGRAAALVRKGRQRPARLYAWIVRTLLCLGAIAIHHSIDGAAIMSWALSAVAFAGAFWDASREKKQEEIKLAINPDDE
jgi:hypothetical protein